MSRKQKSLRSVKNSFGSIRRKPVGLRPLPPNAVTALRYRSAVMRQGPYITMKLLFMPDESIRLSDYSLAGCGELQVKDSRLRDMRNYAAASYYKNRGSLYIRGNFSDQSWVSLGSRFSGHDTPYLSPGYTYRIGRAVISVVPSLFQ